MSEIIGLDIGNVLVRADTDAGTHDAEAWVEVDDAFDATKILVANTDSVWLISKCYENQQKRTRKWLLKTEFYKRTGVNKARVLFCTERQHKAVIAEGLELTHFVDDRVDCLVDMIGTIPYLYQFGTNENESEDFIPLPNWSIVLENGGLP